uniref:BPTI/Kunitz inhibitor domain-containing protein n=1 Tax=Panagrolaimus sp. PS1159 TaxID=55785 RepID=A0AC35GFB4_9BILA
MTEKIILASLCLLLLFDVTLSTKCIVTKWREWSECIGNCDFAQKVRNRDVLKPPFPEKNLETGETILRECPQLYEVQYCTPSSCEENNPFGEENKSKPLKPQAFPKPYPMHFNRLPSAVPSKNTREFFRSLKSKPIPQAPPSAKAAGVSLFRAKARKECDGLDDRCCQIRRILCPDGSHPRKVVRWYREKDEPFCRLYDYPFCGDELDIKESAFLYETNCQEFCFTDSERSVLPSLRLIR